MKEWMVSDAAQGLRVALVVSRFNSMIGEHLIAGAKHQITRSGGDVSETSLVWVPGALELPLAAKWIIEHQPCDAIVALGAVIKGETPHFDHVCNVAIGGLSTLSMEKGMPIGIGVLTTQTFEQALERSGGKQGNKGEEATACALEMANLKKQLSHSR